MNTVETNTRPEAATPVNERDATELRALVATVEDGFNRKRADIADRWFTSDAVVIVADGTIIRGWDDLFAYHTSRLASAASAWRMRMTVLGMSHIAVDTAVVHFRQDMDTPNGTFANHGTLVAVRRDGRWWISALHNTNVAQ